MSFTKVSYEATTFNCSVKNEGTFPRNARRLLVCHLDWKALWLPCNSSILVMQSVNSKNIIRRWSFFLYIHKNNVLEMQSDVSTSVTYQKYLLFYSHFGVVYDSFSHISKCKVSAAHSDLSIHTSCHCCILIYPWLYHSENAFRSLHKNSSWLWRLLL